MRELSPLFLSHFIAQQQLTQLYNSSTISVKKKEKQHPLVYPKSYPYLTTFREVNEEDWPQGP